jgi:hypothetical protein
LFGAWKLVHAKVHGRLKNEQNPNSVLFRPKIKLDGSKFPGVLQRCNSLIDFFHRKWLVSVLDDKRHEVVSVQGGLSCEFH